MASVADVYVTLVPETGKIADGLKRALLKADDDVRAAARRWKKIIDRELSGEEVDVELKVDAKKAKKEIDKATKDVHAVVDLDADTAKAEAKIDAVTRDRKTEIKLDVDKQYLGTAISTAVSGAMTAGGAGAKAGTQVAETFAESFKSAMKGPAGVALGGVVAVGAASMGTQLIGIASSLTGLIGLLPAVGAAGAAAFGTLKLATQGFSDAVEAAVSGDMKKLYEALQGLTPAAQQTVLSIQGIWEQGLKPLGARLQETLFQGIGPQLINTFNALLPAIEPGMQAIAQAFNTAMSSVMTAFQDPATIASIQQIFDNIGRTFQNLAPAIAPFVEGFSKIIEVGTSFLPGIASSITNVANAFNVWVQSNPGVLAEWMQRALTTLQQLIPILPSLVDAFLNLAVHGERLAPKLTDMVVAFADMLNNVGPLLPLLGNMDATLGMLEGSFALAATQAHAFNIELSLVKSTLDLIKDVIDWINSHLPNWTINTPLGSVSIGQGGTPPVLGSSIPKVADQQYVPGGPHGNRPVPPGAPPQAPVVAAPPPPVPAPKSSSGGNAPTPKTPGSIGSKSGWSADWEKIASAESGNTWTIDHGEGPDVTGGLQIATGTWLSHGGGKYAPKAYLATPEQQIAVAEAILADPGQGPNAWPTTYRQHPDWFQPPSSSSAPTPNLGGGGARVPYGMPAGSDSGGYGGSGVQFPDWVGRITQQFGVKPSTYPGHQTSDKGGPGFAPNPQHLNRGIDWKGTPAQMRQLAEWAMQHPEEFEQLIYWDPETGKKYGIGGGKDVTNTPYYENATGYPAHGGPGNLAGAHVHTRQSQSFGPDTVGGTYSYDGPGTSPGNPTYVKSADDTGGKQLGQDIVSGFMEILGIGDIFPDPTQFGAFKIFKGLMGLKPGGASNGGDTGADSGSGGGGGDPLMSLLSSVIPGGTGSVADDLAQWQQPGGNSITDFASQFVPPGPGGNTVDNSFTVNVQGDAGPKAVDNIDNKHTSAMRNLPG